MVTGLFVVEFSTRQGLATLSADFLVDRVTATRLIAADARLAATKVVVLTTFDDDETVFAALRVKDIPFLVHPARARPDRTRPDTRYAPPRRG